MTKRLVYLDNAATTPVRPEVLEAMLPYLGKDAFGNPSSAHRFGRAARAGLEEAKRTIAEALGGGRRAGPGDLHLWRDRGRQSRGDRLGTGIARPRRPVPGPGGRHR